MKPALILLALIPTLYAIERGTVGAVAQLHQARESEAYAWQQVAHLEAENAYAEERTSHLAPLRAAILAGSPSFHR